jgi:hypothetical protein
MPGGNSRDEAARARSLANLQRGGGVPASADHRPALRHGGRAAVSARETEAKVEELRALLSEDTPIRDADGGLPAADRMALHETAVTLVLLDRVRKDMVDHGWKDRETGQPRPVVALESQLSQRAWRQLGECGMTPAGRVRLGVGLAKTFDLALEMSALADEEDAGA